MSDDNTIDFTDAWLKKHQNDVIEQEATFEEESNDITEKTLVSLINVMHEYGFGECIADDIEFFQSRLAIVAFVVRVMLTEYIDGEQSEVLNDLIENLSNLPNMPKVNIDIDIE